MGFRGINPTSPIFYFPEPRSVKGRTIRKVMWGWGWVGGGENTKKNTQAKMSEKNSCKPKLKKYNSCRRKFPFHINC